jgi:ABC-2 type transport system ATP-binding protein
MTSVIRTEQLTKDFLAGFWRPRPRRALDQVSFDVPQGEVFGLLGPNGAGKTTTLKLLMDLLRPTSGRAELFGRPASDPDSRRRVGFVPEQPYYYDHLTADELVQYFAGLSGLTGADRATRAAAVLARAGIRDEDRRRPLRQFSKGMLQRVGLAQALVHDPELVVLDEPMSGLDPIGRRDVRQIILQLRDEGRTVLFSSHILSDAEQLCSHVAILARGRIVSLGKLTDLTAPALRGSEVVVSGLNAETAARITPTVARVTAIADGRYCFELSPGDRPEALIAVTSAAGATLVSVSPVRASLEDVFLEAIQ